MNFDTGRDFFPLSHCQKLLFLSEWNVCNRQISHSEISSSSDVPNYS